MPFELSFRGWAGSVAGHFIFASYLAGWQIVTLNKVLALERAICETVISSCANSLCMLLMSKRVWLRTGIVFADSKWGL